MPLACCPSASACNASDGDGRRAFQMPIVNAGGPVRCTILVCGEMPAWRVPGVLVSSHRRTWSVTRSITFRRSSCFAAKMSIHWTIVLSFSPAGGVVGILVEDIGVEPLMEECLQFRGMFRAGEDISLVTQDSNVVLTDPVIEWTIERRI